MDTVNIFLVNNLGLPFFFFPTNAEYAIIKIFLFFSLL